MSGCFFLVLFVFDSSGSEAHIYKVSVYLSLRAFLDRKRQLSNRVFYEAKLPMIS